MQRDVSKPPRTIAQAEMRAINRSAVLEYLRLAQSASRTELAERLNFSMPTAMRIMDELLRDGFVQSTGRQQGSMGRSRELFQLNTAQNLVIGIDLGGTHISGMVADIGGKILYETRSGEQWAGEGENLYRLVQFIQHMQEHARQIGAGAGCAARVLGAAIGVPGMIESRSGTVKLAPALNWKDYPLLERLQPHFDLNLVIENDVNLAALGEHWFGAGVGLDNLVAVSIGTGIGAGIVLDGCLYRGSRESSGEIGYIVPGITYLNNQYPGFGALESLASGKGIADRAAESLQDAGGLPALHAPDAAAVFQAAHNGEAWAVKLVDETLDFLCLALVNVSVCFDPQLIVLGGRVSASLDGLLERILKRMQRVMPWTLPQIAVSQLKDRAPMLGAVVRIFQKVTGFAVVRGD